MTKKECPRIARIHANKSLSAGWLFHTRPARHPRGQMHGGSAGTGRACAAVVGAVVRRTQNQPGRLEKSWCRRRSVACMPGLLWFHGIRQTGPFAAFHQRARQFLLITMFPGPKPARKLNWSHAFEITDSCMEIGPRVLLGFVVCAPWMQRGSRVRGEAEWENCESDDQFQDER